MENKRKKKNKKKKNKRNKKNKIILNKNKIFVIISCAVLICAIICGTYFIVKKVSNNKGETQKEIIYSDGFSVTFLNVGYGDASIIKFSNGKIMMIDTGSDNGNNYNLILNTLSKLKADKIDYLVLTHPHSDHIGNALKILLSFSVGKLFIPKIYDYNGFFELNSIISKAKELNIETEISKIGSKIEEESAKVFFLAPKEEENSQSVYQELIGESNPSDSIIDNLSPTIYLEYNGVRFLFSGDGGKSVENTVMEMYYTGFYDESVMLESIDFYKVSNHGKSNTNILDYLSLLLPKNAIISTGNDEYGSLEVLNRLNTANENVRILKTDIEGNIAVFVNEKGGTEIKTENDNNN